MGLQILRSPVRFRLRPETALFFFSEHVRARACSSGLKQHPRRVPVAQLDKASDYESEDWGFKSLQGYVFFARSPATRAQAMTGTGVSSSFVGALAQSVECVLCKHEVQGSKP